MNLFIKIVLQKHEIYPLINITVAEMITVIRIKRTDDSPKNEFVYNIHTNYMSDSIILVLRNDFFSK